MNLGRTKRGKVENKVSKQAQTAEANTSQFKTYKTGISCNTNSTASTTTINKYNKPIVYYIFVFNKHQINISIK